MQFHCVLMVGDFTELTEAWLCVYFQSRGAVGDVTWMGFLTDWQELVLLFGTVPPVVIL